MKVRKFKKKPVVIEAIQYDGTNVAELIEFAGDTITHEKNVGSSADGEGHKQIYERVTVDTLEHLALLVSVGDWVIKGIVGEFYPCKSNVFGQTYEEIEE